MTKGPILLFPHIGRTGGDYFNNYISRSLPKFSYLHYDIKEYLWNEFRYLNENNVKHLKFIGGHGLIYGTHQYVNAPTEYIALVRDPVDRVISQYYAYMIDPAYKIHNNFKKQNITLLKYAELNNNMQAKRLTGWPYYYNDQDLGSWTLQNCIGFFNSVYKHVGVTERLSEFVFSIRKKLEINHLPLLSRKRKGKAKKDVNEIEPDIIEKIREYNKIDQALYEAALKRVNADFTKLSDFEKNQLDDFNKRQKLFSEIEKEFDFEVFCKHAIEKILFKGKLNLALLHTRKKNFSFDEAKNFINLLGSKFKYTDLNIIFSNSYDATPDKLLDFDSEVIAKVEKSDYVILITDEGQDFVLGNPLRSKGITEDKMCFLLNSVSTF